MGTISAGLRLHAIVDVKMFISEVPPTFAYSDLPGLPEYLRQRGRP